MYYIFGLHCISGAKSTGQSLYKDVIRVPLSLKNMTARFARKLAHNMFKYRRVGHLLGKFSNTGTLGNKKTSRKKPRPKRSNKNIDVVRESVSVGPSRDGVNNISTHYTVCANKCRQYITNHV